MRPRPPPFTLAPVYARRAKERADAPEGGRQTARVPKELAFTYVPL